MSSGSNHNSNNKEGGDVEITWKELPPQRVPIPWTMKTSALLVSLQSFLFGYVFSALNSCLVTGDQKLAYPCFDGSDASCPPGSIYRDLNLTTVQASLATSLVVLGAWVGSLVASYPSELYGRRWALFWNNAFFIVGALLCASGDLTSLFFGRLISGIGVGASSVLAPVMLAELAAEENRGVITTLHQVALTFAILIAALVGYGLVTYVMHGWQYTVALAVVPSLVMILGAPWIPESPKWLLAKGRREEAVVVLTRLRPVGHDVEAEIEVISKDAGVGGEGGDAEEGDSGGGKKEATWKEVFRYRRAMIIGCGLMFFQAMTGINTVVFYSTTIFGFAGFKQAILGTTSFGVVNFVASIASASLVDAAGRKVLLSIGVNVMLAALLVLSLVLLTANDESVIQGIVAVAAVLTFVLGFAMGLGAVVWVMMSELLPTRLRMKAVSLFLSINWGFNLIVGLVTLSAIDALGGVAAGMTDDEEAQAKKRGVAFLYLFFACVTLITSLFVFFYVPETKGKTPGELNTDAFGSSAAATSDIQSPLIAHMEDEEEQDRGASTRSNR